MPISFLLYPQVKFTTLFLEEVKGRDCSNDSGIEDWKRECYNGN